MEKNMYQLKKISWKSMFENEVDQIGILVHDVTGINYLFVGIDGEVKNIRTKDVTFSTVRGIDPKVREVVNAYGKKRKKDYQEYKKIANTLSIKMKEIDNDWDHYIQRVKDTSGLMAISDFTNIISSEMNTFIYNSSNHSLDKNISFIDVWADEEAVTLQVNERLDKYVNEGSYDFIGVEYDMTLVIHYESSSYRKLLANRDERYRKPSHKPKDIQKMTVSSNLNIGDKNTLYYERNIKFEFKKGFSPTEATAKEIAETVKEIIK